MIASVVFLVFAAMEAIHSHGQEASANIEIAVALLIVGGLWLWRVRLLAERADRLAISGTETPGVVTGMAKTWFQGWGDSGTTRYALRFSYHDEGGRAHRGTAICAQTDAFQWRTGDRGLVHYDDEHPSRSVWMGRVEGNAAPGAIVQSAAPTRGPSPPAGEMVQPALGRLVARSPHLRGAVLPLVLLGYVSVLALVFWNSPNGSVAAKILLFVFASTLLLRGTAGIAQGVRQVRAWSRLLRDGALAEATVTAVRERARFVGLTKPVMRTFWTIEYRYPDRAGLTRDGTSAATQREAAELRPGDTIAIKYDQDASVWIDKLADRAV